MAITIKITILLLFFVGLSSASSMGIVESFCLATTQTIDENGSTSSKPYEISKNWQYYPNDVREEIFESQLQLDGLSLRGGCECTLTMYSKINGKGCFTTRNLTSKPYDGNSDGYPVTYDLRDLWTRTSNPRSFRLDCKAPWVELS